jgi:hypothetical protein
MAAKAGHTDFEFKSESPGLWCLTKKGRDAWVHITLACSTVKTVVRSVLTNDASLIKQTLADPGEGLALRSFQMVFPSDFPDNIGVGVADIYEMKEAQTKRGEIFHSFYTRFGIFRIGGPVELMASQVKFGSDVTLYTAARPRPRYYGH